MEQSIKSVLVKQTIAHQQQQLTNLQVSCPPSAAASAFSSSSRACGCPRRVACCSVSQRLLGTPRFLPEARVAQPDPPVESPRPPPNPPLRPTALPESAPLLGLQTVALSPCAPRRRGWCCSP